MEPTLGCRPCQRCSVEPCRSLQCCELTTTTRERCKQWQQVHKHCTCTCYPTSRISVVRMLSGLDCGGEPHLAGVPETLSVLTVYVASDCASNCFPCTSSLVPRIGYVNYDPIPEHMFYLIYHNCMLIILPYLECLITQQLLLLDLHRYFSA